MVFDQDDADPQREFWAWQGFHEEEHDFNRPTGRSAGPRRGSGLHDFDEKVRNPERWNRRRTTNGPFSGVGPRGYQKPDNRIYEEICQRLTDHGAIDPSDIQVEVRNREVTLMGTVRDRRMKRLAEDIASSVSGVEDVMNQIRVNREKESDRTILGNKREDETPNRSIRVGNTQVHQSTQLSEERLDRPDVDTTPNRFS